MNFLLHIVLVCALANVVSCSTGANLSIPKSRVKKTGQIVIEEVLPEVETLLNMGLLPGVNNEAQHVLGTQLRLCSVEDSANIRRIVLLTTSTHESVTKEEISHLFINVPPSKNWELRSAWRTRADGERELIDVAASKKIKPQSARLNGLARQSSNHKESELSSHFELPLTLDYGDTLQLGAAVDHFWNLAQSGRIPYVKSGEWDRFSLLPLSNVQPDQRPRMAQFLVPLKDGSADFVYLLREDVGQKHWVLSSVLKLNADGKAIMLPVK